MHDYGTHGKSALRKAGRAGRKPRLEMGPSRRRRCSLPVHIPAQLLWATSTEMESWMS